MIWKDLRAFRRAVQARKEQPVRDCQGGCDAVSLLAIQMTRTTCDVIISLRPTTLTRRRATRARRHPPVAVSAHDAPVSEPTQLDPAELEEARRWFTAAAEAGRVSAQIHLGVLLATQLDPPELGEARRLVHGRRRSR